MLSLGIILLILGVIVLVIAYTVRGPAPLHPIGWALVAIGAVLIIVGLVVPTFAVHTAAMLLLR
jgi:hypothetical protein